MRCERIYFAVLALVLIVPLPVLPQESGATVTIGFAERTVNV
jgi:hypothetical protein